MEVKRVKLLPRSQIEWLRLIVVSSSPPHLHRGEELLLTELIFNGAFNDLSVEQAVALLSCFVFQEKVCRDMVASL